MKLDFYANLDKVSLKRLQDKFAETLQCQVILFNAAGDPVITSGREPDVCTLVSEQKICDCSQHRQEKLKRAQRLTREAVEFFTCPAGIQSLVANVRLGEENVGLIVVKGFVLGDSFQQNAIRLMPCIAGALPDLHTFGQQMQHWHEQELKQNIELLKLYRTFLVSYLSINLEHSIRNFSLSTLRRLVKLDKSLSAAEIYAHILDIALTLPGVDCGWIGSMNAERDVIRPINLRGIRPEELASECHVGRGFGGWVAREKKPLVVSDVNQDPRYSTSLLKTSRISMLCCFPILGENGIVALLYIGGRKKKKMDPEELVFLKGLTEVAGLIVELVQARQKLENQIRCLRALTEISRVVNSTLDLTTVLNLIVDMTTNIFETKVVYICLANEDSGELELKVARGISPVHSLGNDPGSLPGSQFSLKAKENVVGILGIQFSRANLSEQEQELIDSFCNLAGVAIEKSKIFTQIVQTTNGAIRALLRALEARDPFTFGHSERVARYAVLLAGEMGLNEKTVETVKTVAYLHDIGKIGVPEAILTKSGSLSDAEFQQVKLHPVIGAEIISAIPELADLVPGVLHHHEWYDGSGYPDGLKGDEIPLEAQIIGIADMYDALVSQRSFRDALDPGEAYQIIESEVGRHFKPDIFRAFSRVIKEDLLINVDKEVPTKCQKAEGTMSGMELTEREGEVLGLIAEGLNNKEIAEQLGISEKTVKTHITNILRKLNVNDRTKAAICAIKGGLIPFHPGSDKKC